jgi:TonB family protein
MKFRTVPVALAVILVASGLLYGQKAPKSKTKEEHVYFSSEVTAEPRIIESPDPSYTEQARKKGISGLVVIRCIFRASGEITDIFVASGLGQGLTKQAVEAVKKIKFAPALKDGHPVSVWVEVQYKFSLDKRDKKEATRLIA